MLLFWTSRENNSSTSCDFNILVNGNIEQIVSYSSDKIYDYKFYILNLDKDVESVGVSTSDGYYYYLSMMLYGRP